MGEDSTEPLDDSVLNKLNQIITIVQSLDSRGQQMEARISALETKVDERLYDTRPIWERVLVELVELRTRQEQLHAGQEQLQAAQEEMRVEIAELRAGQEQLKAGQEEMRAEIAELHVGQKELRTTMWEGFHKVERQLMVLSKDFLERRAEVEYLERRIDKLESERA